MKSIADIMPLLTLAFNVTNKLRNISVQGWIRIFLFEAAKYESMYVKVGNQIEW